MDTTTELIFRIFTPHSNYNFWEKHIEFAKLAPEIQDSLKIELIESLEFLKKELSPSFLRGSDDLHPLRPYITDKSKWRIQYLIHFANTLKRLKGFDCNYSILLDKIRSTNSCRDEGIPFVDIAEAFLRNSFEIKFLPIESGMKSSDFKIANPKTKESVFIELTVVNESDLKKQADDCYDILLWKLTFDRINIPHSGKLLKLISQEQIIQTLNEIDEAKTKALTDRENFVFLQNDKLDLIFAHPDKINELKNWCDVNQRRMWFDGLTLDFNETKRIMKNEKIKIKAEQLPKNKPGLLFFIVNPLYFWQIDIDETIEQFNSDMEKFPNLLGIVMYSYELNPTKPKQVRFGNHFYGCKMMNEVMCRTLYFVSNNHFNVSMSLKTREMIYSSFM